jgi:hypothetical protein
MLQLREPLHRHGGHEPSQPAALADDLVAVLIMDKMPMLITINFTVTCYTVYGARSLQEWLTILGRKWSRRAIRAVAQRCVVLP